MFINKKEALYFYNAISLMESASKGVEELKVKLKEEMKRDLNSNNLFVSLNPRYHSKVDCKTLNSDFLNFHIPQEIKDRGADEVQKFRNFAIENRYLINDGREDVFQQRLSSKFLLNNKLASISRPNSGVQSGMIAEFRDLKKLSLDIELILSQINAIKLKPGGEKVLKDRIYLKPEYRMLPHENPLFDELNDLKGKLVNLLMEFNIYRSFKSDKVSFSDIFLQELGFQPCRVCCKGGLTG